EAPRGQGPEAPSVQEPEAPSGQEPEAGAEPETKARPVQEPEAGPAQAEAGNVSPIARRIAAQQGIDLSRVEGSARGGRITKADVLAAAGDGDGAATAAPPEAPPATAPAQALPPTAPGAPTPAAAPPPGARPVRGGAAA